MRIETVDPDVLAEIALVLRADGELYGDKRRELIEKFCQLVDNAPDGIALAQIVEATKHCGLWPKVYPTVKERNARVIETIDLADSASGIDEILNRTQDENGILPRAIWARARDRVCALAQEVTAPSQLPQLTALASLAKARGMWRSAGAYIQDADMLLNSIMTFEIGQSALILCKGSETIMPDDTGHARRLYESGYVEVHNDN